MNGTLSYDATLADLVAPSFTSSTSAYLSPTSGLFQWTDYYNGTASTATATSPGSVLGYEEDTAISQGLDGTRYYQSFTDYFNYTNTTSGATIVNVADSTTFPSNLTSSSSGTLTVADFQGAGGDTTSYAYSFFPGTNQVEEMTTSLPDSSSDGPGTPDVSTVVYDTLGQPVWTMDANGYIDYTKYDTENSGAVVETITDVNTSDTGDFSNLPSGWTTPAGGGLNLVTSYQVDNQGRTIEETDPNGNVTYTVYDDADNAVFTIPDAVIVSGNFTNGTITTTAPMSMERNDIPYEYTTVSWSDGYSSSSTLTGSYTESLTFSGTLTVSSGVVVVPEFVSSDPCDSSELNILKLNSTAGSLTLQSLSRSLSNSGSQMVESDSYFVLGTATDSNSMYLSTGTNSPYSGTLNLNYYATYYSYDDMGRQARIIDPNGTITDTTYDAQGRVLATFVGTDDSPTSDYNGYGDPDNGDWEDFLYYVEHHNNAIPSGTNMTLVSQNIYDDGGVGDGNLTETISYPGGALTPRATEYLYDWQDQQISSKSGVATALPSGFTVSNIGSVTLSSRATFDGSTFALTGGGDGFGINGTTNTGDSFSFLSQSISGNTTLVTRVDGLTNEYANSEAGLVLRDGSSTGALSVAVVFVPGDGVEFLWRTSVNATTFSSSFASGISSPVWLELVRSGNTFSASYATSSSLSWIQVGSTESITMSTSLMGGLAVATGDDPSQGVGIFDNASINGNFFTSSLYETDGANRTLTVNTLDNMGEVIATSQYAADKMSMVDSNADGIPDAMSTGTLTAYSTTAYDPQGRGYQTTTYSVDPSSGATNGSLTLVSDTRRRPRREHDRHLVLGNLDDQERL